MTSSNYLVDEKDMLILRHIEEYGRGSYQEIAESVNLSATTVYERIKKLKEKDIIVSDAVPVIDCTKLPEIKNLIILIEAEPGCDIKKIGRVIVDIKGVKAVYRLCGESDYFIHLCCLGRSEVEKSIQQIGAIPGVRRLRKEMIEELLKEGFQTFCRTEEIESSEA